MSEEVRDLLSGDPHHVVIQVLLGHPKHLASAEEIAHIAGGDVGGALADLMDAGIVATYHEPSNDEDGLPTTFYSFSEYGVGVLEDFNYLRGVQMARAVHQKTRKPERIQRHEDAPRPSLPAGVREAFRPDDESWNQPKPDRVLKSEREALEEVAERSGMTVKELVALRKEMGLDDPREE